MTNQAKAKKTNLESILSRVAGVSIEITFLSEHKFSFCFEGQNKKAISNIKSYFGTQMAWDTDEAYDKECDHSAIYGTAKTNH